MFYGDIYKWSILLITWWRISYSTDKCHICSDRKNIKIRTPSHHQVRQILFSDWEDFDQLNVKIDSFHQHPSKQRCVKIVLNHRNQATKDLKYKTSFFIVFFTTKIKLLFKQIEDEKGRTISICKLRH